MLGEKLGNGCAYSPKLEEDRVRTLAPILYVAGMHGIATADLLAPVTRLTLPLRRAVAIAEARLDG